MNDVFYSDEFGIWFKVLEEKHKDSVAVAVDKLEVKGVDLGYPESSQVKGTKYPLRELRIKSHGHVIRVIYIFDMKRDAYLILGGDKTGKNKKRFYKQLIAQGEKILKEYLAE